MKSLMSEDQRKHLFLVLLYNRDGNVAETCRDMKMSRQTFRKWQEEDEEFALECEEVGESLIDFTEGKLLENVAAGKERSIEMMLTKSPAGRRRGWGRGKLEIEHTGGIAHAHLHGHYPVEPESIADWEAQVIEAEQAESERQLLTAIDKEANDELGSITGSEPNECPVTTA